MGRLERTNLYAIRIWCRLNATSGSTAGCGKPHVRWCGRGDGRNPVTPTRSLKLCLQGNIKQSLKHCIPKLELGNEKYKNLNIE